MDTRTVEEAKTYVVENRAKGVTCPCCEQFVKMYERPLTSAMACALIAVYWYYKRRTADQDEWLHVGKYLNNVPGIPWSVKNTGDFAKLTFWGLVEPLESTREDGSSRNGYYRITDKGNAFVEGMAFVPSHALIFNNGFYGFSEKQIFISDALRKKFSYDDLMGRFKDGAV